MKNHHIRSTIILTASFALLTLAACSKSDRSDIADKTKDAYQDTKDAVVQGWKNVKGFTFEKRSDFSKQLNAQQAEFEAQVSKLRATYAEAEASASRKAAMAELKDSEANFKEKVAAVGTATADTWDAARDNVSAAWDRMQASYAKARAN